MRINSNRTYKFNSFLYVLAVLTFLFDAVIANIDGSWGSMTKVSPYALGLLAFLYYRGLPVFEYDSDGEVLNFTARDPNLQMISNSFVKHTEFPKRKLVRFEIKRYPFRRRLHLYIDSKNHSLKKQSVSISYLSRREVKDLNRSLLGVISRNKEKENAR